MNQIQYMKEGGNFGNKLKTRIKNLLYQRDPFGYTGGLFIPKPAGADVDKRMIARNGYNQRKALQQMYLGIEDKDIPVDEFVIESKYKPSINNGGNNTYYTFVELDNPETKLKKFAWYGGGSRRPGDYSHMTISKGRDQSGDYYGLYDTWNFDSYKPIQKMNQIFNTDIERAAGFNPVELYDRIYLDDYYNIPEDKRGGNYLNELVVTPTNAKFVHHLTKEKSGGSIHIKKKNRGKFTDYCGGKVTEECIRKGKNSSNPTTRKRANFTWVARHKFKHEEGGKINYLNLMNNVR